MFKLLEKWLVVYILVFTAGFSVLGIGLSFAFKDFFYKQQQNIILKENRVSLQLQQAILSQLKVAVMAGKSIRMQSMMH